MGGVAAVGREPDPAEARRDAVAEPGPCPLFGPQRLPSAETAVDLGFGGGEGDLWAR